jgi:hypothetical protein
MNIIFFLIISSVFAQTKTEIQNKIKTIENPHFIFKQCDFKDHNWPTAFKRIYDDRNLTDYNCVLTAINQYEAIKAQREAEETEKQNARQYLQNFNCDTLAGFQKAICLQFK